MMILDEKKRTKPNDNFLDSKELCYKINKYSNETFFPDTM